MDDEQQGAPAAHKRPSFRSLRHQLLARLLEIALTPVDINVESEIRVMSEPPMADILLLRRRGRQWSHEQRKLLPDGIRDRHAHHHLLECKFSEAVNEAALQQALSYDYFYRQTQQIKAAELQTYVVGAQTPRVALLNRFGYHGTDLPGVYVSSQPLLEKIVMLVINELRNEPQNELLRLFASRQQVRRQTIENVMQKQLADWPEQFWSIVFGLQRVYQLENITMQQEITVDDVMEIGAELRRLAIASASPKERLAGLAPEDRLAGLAPEDRLAGLAPEDRLAGLAPEDRLAGLAPEDRLAGLTPEQMADLLKQIEALLAQQPAGAARQRRPSKPH
jgi:hypothetical protein